MQTVLVTLAALTGAVALLVLVRRLVFSGRSVPGAVLEQDLEGRIVVVTGANDGIGKATARILARAGCTVVMACRSEDRALGAVREILGDSPSVGEERLRFIHLDLADLASVRSFAHELRRTLGRLDVLVNNAGIAIDTSLGLTRDGIEAVFQTNHLAHFYLTSLLEDLIVESDARVINVSSHGHRLCTTPAHLDDVTSPMTGPGAGFILYARSKLANILFTRELDRRLKSTHPGYRGDVFALTPGRVYTPIWRKNIPWWGLWYFKLARHFFMRTEREGASTSVYCALAPELQGRGGAYLDDLAFRDPSPLARDDALARRLWSMSEEHLGISFLPEDQHS